MTGQMEISDIAKETVEVLKYFDFDFLSKISTNFLKFLEELAKNSSKIVKIDKNKKLKEQNVSNECKSLITLIYYTYIANTEEKKKIEKIWNENELKYQQELRKKYNPEEIFKRNFNKNKESLQMVEIKKENIWIKLLKKIKKFFNKNKE